MGGTRMRSVFSDGTASVNGNGAVFNLNDDVALEDVWDDGMTFDMVTDAEGEGDEEVSFFSFSFLVLAFRFIFWFSVLTPCRTCDSCESLNGFRNVHIRVDPAYI